MSSNRDASKIFTIGFTHKTAEHFFTLLKENKVKRVIDVRAHNTSQLAGFAKNPDLGYLLKEILQVEYVEIPELTPDPNMVKAYRAGEIDWEQYAQTYQERLDEFRVESIVDPALLEHGCLLCSEHEPHTCHRKVAAEYLTHKLRKNMKIQHLM